METTSLRDSSGIPIPSRSVDSLRGRPVQTTLAGDTQASLILDPQPGAIGGEVGGIIDVALPYAAKQRFRVTLFNQLVYPGSDTGNSVNWVETGSGLHEAGPLGTCIRFRFVVPEDQLPSGRNKPAERSLLGVAPTEAKWTLRLEQPTAERTWEFDVAVKRETGARLSEAVSNVPDSGKTGAPPVAPTILYRRSKATWLALIQPPERRPLGAAVALLFGVTFLYAGLSSGFAGVVFTTIGAGFTGIAVYAFGLRSNLAVTQGAILIQRWWFGAMLRKKTIVKRRIHALKIVTRGTLPIGESRWSLELVTDDGTSTCLVRGLHDSRQAHVLRRWIERVLDQGLPAAALEGELPLAEFIRERVE